MLRKFSWLSSFILFVVNTGFSQQEVFVPNRGQFPENVQAYSALNIGNSWICNDGITFQFWDPKKIMEIHDRAIESTKIPTQVVKLSFVGGTLKNPEYYGNKSSHYINYYKGNDSKKWVTGIHKYSNIRFHNVYSGVDLEIVSGLNGIKYNWICNASDIVKIKIKVDGAECNLLDASTIHFKTKFTEWDENIPSVYLKNDPSQTLNCEYALDSSVISYRITSASPSKNKKIVVDPVLVFSTYSGSRADNFGCTGTFDDFGNGYSGGTVFDFGLPTTTGAVQVTFGGGQPEGLGYGGDRDMAILKYNSTGTSLIYCTYLGGNDNEQPHSMVVDSLNNLFVMGTTKSKNFPMVLGYDNIENGNYDFVITKFNSLGTSIVGSTYFGGSYMDGVGADRSVIPVDNYPLLYNYADEFRGEIITDNKNVYVVGITYSADFPNTLMSPSNTNNEKGVVFALSQDLKKLIWSQEIIAESNSHTALYGIAIGKNDDIFVTGGTTAKDFQTHYANWINSSHGDVDAILIRLSKSTGAFINGKYFGTGNYEQSYFVQTDLSGNPYIFGQTEGVLPIINSPYSQPGMGQFIVKHSADLSSVLIQTTFGANGNMPNISPSAFLVDRCERIFVSGWGGATNTALYDASTGYPKVHRNKGNTRNMDITSNALQSKTDGSDFYIAVFNKNMYSLAFATYFGGITNATRQADEHVDGGTSRFDKKGIIYQSVCAGCERNGLFPTTPGAYSRTMNSDNCNNALFKIDFENLNRKPVMGDTFIKIKATQQIQFKKWAIDADIFDTVRLKYQWINRGKLSGSDSPNIVLNNGIGKASVDFNWKTLCSSWSKDTLKIKVFVADCGCPKADTTFAIISILITEPPVIVPPDAVCVSYDRATAKMKISWPQSYVPGGFFKYFLLEKTDPSGKVTIVDTVRNTLPGFYIDSNVVNPRTNNYCYALLGVSICDVIIRPSLKYCTIGELNTPISEVHLISASVFQDKRVDVKWEKSKEPDFKEYEVYRYPLNGKRQNLPTWVTTDTLLSDSALNVDNQSFCYEIVVTDKCGHYSNSSNKGCNVIIDGSAVGAPDYHFNLNWDTYRGWDSGVSWWNLERMYGPFNFSSIHTTQYQSFIDNQLDYDWGGYWYRVTGYEKPPASGKFYNGVSESNWIYLIQPPEVWVPDAFTVNGDNLNEVWGTVPVFVKGYSMKVYNRWGEKIWESTAKKQQWDGTFEGKDVQDGVYGWLLEFDGWNNKTYRKTGTVLVIH